MAYPDDTMERRRGQRDPSIGTPAGRGKGTGAAPTRSGMAWPKMTVVVEQGRGSGGGGVGRQLHEAVQGSNW
jgi:hypothetical protein